MQPPRTGCAVLATRLDPGAAVRAVRPPDPVLRQLQRIPKFTTKTTHYIALEDGSLFMHPPKSKDKLLVCDDYEFRSRYSGGGWVFVFLSRFFFSLYLCLAFICLLPRPVAKRYP